MLLFVKKKIIHVLFSYHFIMHYFVLVYCIKFQQKTEKFVAKWENHNKQSSQNVIFFLLNYFVLI